MGVSSSVFAQCLHRRDARGAQRGQGRRQQTGREQQAGRRRQRQRIADADAVEKAFEHAAECERGDAVLAQLWQREMPVAVYDPRWLPCHTPQGPVQALAFTLSRRSPHYTGTLPMEQYRRIFAQAQGRYGSTQDYALDTYEGLRAVGIHDRALRRLIESAQDSQGDTPTAQSGA